MILVFRPIMFDNSNNLVNLKHGEHLIWTVWRVFNADVTV